MSEEYEDVALDVDVEGLPDSDALPVGKYSFRIDAVEATLDKKDRPFLKFKYVVIEGEHSLREVRENYVPTKGRAILKKILRAVEWKHKKLTTANQIKLIGMEFNAITRIETSDEYGDQTRISVYLNPNSSVSEDSAPV